MVEVQLQHPYLRHIEEEDAEQLIGWINIPNLTGRMAKYPVTLPELHERLALQAESLTDLEFSIIEGGEVIGICGINNINWRRGNGQLSIIVRKEHQHKGLGSYALHEIIKIGFEELRLHKLWIEVFPESTAGRNLYRKLNFKEEGVLKEEYLHNDSYHDLIRLSRIGSSNFEEVSA